MLTDIMLGQYFPGNSFVHKLDPRSKIVLTLVFISSIFLATNYTGYLVLGVFLCLSTAVAGIPAKIMVRSIKPLWIILLLTAGIHIVMTPGTPYEITIDVGATGNVFLTGHRLRLEVSSSNFPRYDRNPNTGAPFATDVRTVVARQTVFHDAAKPSRLVLPVIPR